MNLFRVTAALKSRVASPKMLCAQFHSLSVYRTNMQIQTTNACMKEKVS